MGEASMEIEWILGLSERLGRWLLEVEGAAVRVVGLWLAWGRWTTLSGGGKDSAGLGACRAH